MFPSVMGSSTSPTFPRGAFFSVIVRFMVSKDFCLASAHWRFISSAETPVAAVEQSVSLRFSPLRRARRPSVHKSFRFFYAVRAAFIGGALSKKCFSGFGGTFSGFSTYPFSCFKNVDPSLGRLERR